MYRTACRELVAGVAVVQERQDHVSSGYPSPHRTRIQDSGQRTLEDLRTPPVVTRGTVPDTSIRSDVDGSAVLRWVGCVAFCCYVSYKSRGQWSECHGA